MSASARSRTKPLKVDLRAVFDAVIYVLRDGSRRRSLPHDYPGWSTVYYHFNKWRSHIDEAGGLPLLELALNPPHVTTANISDKAGAKEMIEAGAGQLAKVQKVLVDGGYAGQPFSGFVRETIGAQVEVAKRHELHTFAVIPKRRVVERSFAWLEKCRRLWKNCERKLSTSLAMMRLAFLTLILKRF